MLRQSDADVATVVGAGITVFEALAAYDQLKAEGIAIRVIDLYSLAPVDKDALIAAGRASQQRIITVEDHYPAGGIGDAVAEAVGVDLVVRQGSTPAPWHPGRCAELVVGATVVGYAGELSPRACEEAGLARRTSAMELNLDELISAADPVVTARPLSSFPVAKEDLALVVDLAVPTEAVEQALRNGAGELLESVRLFDVYTGDQIERGKKSLAFSLRLRAPDRTLNVEEVSAARAAAIESARASVGATLRQ